MGLYLIRKIYDESLAGPLVGTLHELFDRYPRAKALFSVITRNEQTQSHFLALCSES